MCRKGVTMSELRAFADFLESVLDRLRNKEITPEEAGEIISKHIDEKRKEATWQKRKDQRNQN